MSIAMVRMLYAAGGAKPRQRDQRRGTIVSTAVWRALRVAGKREAAEQPVDAGEEASRLRRDAGDVGPIELVAQLPTHLVPGRRAGVIVEAATRNKAEGEKRGWLTAGWQMPGAGRAPFGRGELAAHLVLLDGDLGAPVRLQHLVRRNERQVGRLHQRAVDVPQDALRGAQHGLDVARPRGLVDRLSDVGPRRGGSRLRQAAQQRQRPCEREVWHEHAQDENLQARVKTNDGTPRSGLQTPTGCVTAGETSASERSGSEPARGGRSGQGCV